MRVLGIDPGLTGACALFDVAKPQQIEVFDMPVIGHEVDVHALTAQLRELMAIDVAYIERVGPQPRDGVRQAWRFSSAYTAARTVVTLLQIPIELVAPGTWKAAYKLRGSDKSESRQRAVSLFPGQAALFCRVKDSGRAEAALLALLGSRGPGA